MDLRPTYGFVSHAANQQLEAQRAAVDDAERKIVKAKHKIAEAMLEKGCLTERVCGWVSLCPWGCPWGVSPAYDVYSITKSLK